MEKEFWIDKWQKRQIGFHQSAPHKQLCEQFEKIGFCDSPKNALVPLCGKSLDIIWLSNKCAQVTGVEFSKQAIDEFFVDNNLDIMEEGLINDLPFFKHGNITLVQGDFFNLPVADYDFIYDRAAIVAIDPKDRKRYANKLKEVSSAGAKILLIAFEYDQRKVNGPPFCVPQDQIKGLFENECEIEVLHEKSEKPKSPKFVEAKVSSFVQKTYLIKKINSK